MPIRGRVGRHVNTGRQCQNWKSDQERIIALLNRIPISSGGAEGMIKSKVVPGYASQELYTSILYFQNKHFPSGVTGFVDPGGPVSARIEFLASRPATPAPKANQWDYITTQSVENALRKGLEDDGVLSHVEVVNIVRSVLSDGVIDAKEVADLATVLSTSKSISPRSRKMLDTLVSRLSLAGAGPYTLRSDRQRYAAKMTCDFLESSGASHFPRLDRDEVGIGLLMRIANPGLMNQDQASLCGPAALLFGIMSDNPIEYARFAIDLFEKGKGKLYRLEIKPGTDVRHYQPPRTMDQVDWLTMASIRDSENWFLDYDTAEKEFAGFTLPGEMADWMRRSGYSDVQEETNLVFSKSTSNIDAANRLFNQNYRILLFIKFNMLEEATQSKQGGVTEKHWIVQRSLIDRSNGKIKMRVFSWGDGEYQIPHGNKELSVDDFLDNFYGYVAGKP